MKHFLAATYSRSINVSMDRMFENVRDWEHLPHLHSSTFASFDLLKASTNSFQVRAEILTAGLKFRQEFSLHASRKRGIWIVKILSGFQKGLIIHSEASPKKSSGINIKVKFFLPKQKWFYWPLMQLAPMTYRKLYDEDVEMMIARQVQLNADTHKLDGKHCLGPKSDVLKSVPFIVQFAGNSYNVVQSEGELYAFSTKCPHWNATLEAHHCQDLIVKCPWHGYHFELDHSGRCDRGRLRLDCPRVLIRNDLVWLEEPNTER